MAVAPRERRATRDRSDVATAVRIGARSRGHAVTSFIGLPVAATPFGGECQSLTCPRSWAGRPYDRAPHIRLLGWSGMVPRPTENQSGAQPCSRPVPFLIDLFASPYWRASGSPRAEPSDRVCTGHRRADSDASEPRLRYGIKSGRSPIESMTKSGGRRARSSASFRNLPVLTRTPVTPLS